MVVLYNAVSLLVLITTVYSRPVDLADKDQAIAPHIFRRNKPPFTFLSDHKIDLKYPEDSELEAAFRTANINHAPKVYGFANPEDDKISLLETASQIGRNKKDEGLASEHILEWQLLASKHGLLGEILTQLLQTNPKNNDAMTACWNDDHTKRLQMAFPSTGSPLLGTMTRLVSGPNSKKETLWSPVKVNPVTSATMKNKFDQEDGVPTAIRDLKAAMDYMVMPETIQSFKKQVSAVTKALRDNEQDLAKNCKFVYTSMQLDVKFLELIKRQAKSGLEQGLSSIKLWMQTYKGSPPSPKTKAAVPLTNAGLPPTEVPTRPAPPKHGLSSGTVQQVQPPPKTQKTTGKQTAGSASVTTEPAASAKGQVLFAKLKQSINDKWETDIRTNWSKLTYFKDTPKNSPANSRSASPGPAQ
ncbi:uncharacterized protein PpBr36_09308 [Pyricularia pennisetigena]|uniref:uncharacterized protein n=1 Tax=Pyricularia pennisetigena TaxID=1578925 RepID=UPI0011503187|nr:uncharacterized protein PpBr36_09308 [Pyricularia pennisetigena]TLS21786.1 hypothetical protein PpBr36_09308 [Pyricularia pennisetigena]